MDTIFISYSFSNPNSAALCRLAREVASRLRWVTIVDGRDLVQTDFSGEISSFIKGDVDCLVAIFTSDENANPNVLYEIGIAVGADKGIVLIGESPREIPSMLSKYHVVKLNRNRLDWQDDFRIELEQKLRGILQISEVSLVEDKLARRYQPEEIRHLHFPGKVQAAIEAIRAGDLLKAEAVLNRLLGKETENLDALFLLADCIYLKGCSSHDPSDRERFFHEQYDTALRALSLDPNHLLSLHSMGQAEMRLGRFADAQQKFSRVLEMDPDFSLAHYNLSCLSAFSHDKSEALALLETAIRMNAIWKDFAKGDPDFASLREDKDWITLVY